MKGPGTDGAARDAGLLLARVMVGFVLAFHGYGKLFGEGGPAAMAGHLEKMGIPLPLFSAWCAALAEFGGGILIAAGAWTRIVAVPVVFTMLVAFFKGHGGKFSMAEGGGEYALTLALVVAAVGLTGAGRISVDGLCARRPHAGA
jgi:putative oxidoreductase